MIFPSSTRTSLELGNENASEHNWSRESAIPSISRDESWCGNVTTVTTFDLLVGVYATAAVCVVGAFGNAAALFVLLRAQTGSRSSVRSMFPVLRALSACDLALLLVWIPFQVLPVFVEGHLDLLPEKVRCQSGRLMVHLVVYLNSVVWLLHFAITWLTVLVSLERWVAICLPFLAKRLLTRTRSHLAILGVLLAALLHSLPRFFEYRAVPLDPQLGDGNSTALGTLLSTSLAPSVEANQSWRTLMGISQNTGWLYTGWKTGAPNWTLNGTQANESSTKNISCQEIIAKQSDFGLHPIFVYGYALGVHAAFMFLIPLVLITIFNVLLIREILSSRRRWSSLTRSQQRQQRITRLPICIVGLFLLLGLPNMVATIVDVVGVYYEPLNKFKQCSMWSVMMATVNFLVVLNSALNFVIYYANGKKFRTQFMQLFIGRHFKRYSLFNTSTHLTNGSVSAHELPLCRTGPTSALPYIDRLRKNASAQAAHHSQRANTLQGSDQHRPNTLPAPLLRKSRAHTSASASASRTPSALFETDSSLSQLPHLPFTIPRRDSRYMMLVPPTGTLELALTSTASGTPDTARTLLDASSLSAAACFSTSDAHVLTTGAFDLPPIDSDEAINQLIVVPAEPVAGGASPPRRRLTHIVSVSFYDLPVSSPSPSASARQWPQSGTDQTHDSTSL